MNSSGTDDVMPWLQQECHLDENGAQQLAAYISAEQDALGVMPSDTDIVFERFFDDAGGMQLVVHAPFGGRVNRAFGLALRKRFCVRFDFELQAAADDNAVVLSMGPQHSFPLEDAFHFVTSKVLRPSLEQAILYAPMWGTRWRWNATRALQVLRSNGGKQVPPPIQRMLADDLMAADDRIAGVAGGRDDLAVADEVGAARAGRSHCGVMEFALLGPLEARRDGVAVPLGGPRQRAVLAILLFFVAGAWVLSLVDEEEGMRAVRSTVP